jgi:hypothetical protein
MLMRRHRSGAVTLLEAFKAEALRELQAQLDALRTLDFVGALSLPETQYRDIALCGREAQLTIFRQSDQPRPGHVLVTAQIARHTLGGVTSLKFEKGLVFPPVGPVRDATEEELLRSGG